MQYYPTLLLIVFSFSSIAQQLVRGVVGNKESNAPTLYTNIGIVNTAVGTCAYEDGTLSLMIPNDQLNEQMTFLAIGYKVRRKEK